MKTSEMTIIKFSRDDISWVTKAPVTGVFRIPESHIDLAIPAMVPFAHHTMIELCDKASLEYFKDHPNLIKDYELHEGEDTPYRRLVESKDEHE